MGTTTVTIKVWDKATNKVVNKFNVAVTGTIKATAETVTVEVPATVKQGETVTVKAPKNDSYARTIEVKDAEGKTVEATRVDKSYAFNFVAEKAGEYTVTISTSNGVKVVKTVTAESTALKATEVKQVASNAFAITWNKDVEALGLYKDTKAVSSAGTSAFTTSDVYSKIGETVIPFSTVSGVKSKGNVTTVSFYGDFATSTTYFVKAEGDTFEFVGTAKEPTDVVSAAIVSNVVYKDTYTTIDVRLYNKDGIDITHALKAKDVNAYVTLSDPTSMVTFDGLKGYMWNVGDKANVVAKYAYYDASKNETTECETVGTIECQWAPADYVTGVSFSIENATDRDKTGNGNNWMAMGDSKELQIKVSYKNDFNCVNGSSRMLDNTVAGVWGGRDLEAYVAQESIAQLVKKPGERDYTIIANSTGTTRVVVYCVDWDGVTKVPLTSFEISVKAERYPATLTAKFKDGKATFNTGIADDVTVVATVLDQYGAPYTGANVKVSQTDASKDKIANFATIETKGWNSGLGGIPVVIGALSWAKPDPNGTVGLVVECTDWNAKTGKPQLHFSVKNAGAANDFKLVADKNSMDTAVAYCATGQETATISASQWRDGFYVGTQTFNGNYVTSRPTKKTGASEVRYSYTLTKDGVPFAVSGSAINLSKKVSDSLYAEVLTYADFITVSDSSISIKKYAEDANGNIVKLPSGSYTLTVYKETIGANDSNWSLTYRTATVVVKDSQVAPTFVQVNNTVDSSANGDIAKAFRVYVPGNGAPVPVSKLEYDCVATSSLNTIFVKSVVIKFNVGDKEWDDSLKDKEYKIRLTINTLVRIAE